MLINSIELFAGCGGLALGMEKAGFNHVLLNELDKSASATLIKNRPNWNVLNCDIKNIDWKNYRNIDFVSGGFPCQSFSTAGKKLGFNDVRGTLFYEFARCIRDTNPILFLAENVKGLLFHDNKNTLKTIINVFEDLDYHIYPVLLLNANNYLVAQKRERIFICGIKKELKDNFNFFEPEKKEPIFLKDILIKNEIYCDEIKDFSGSKYSKKLEDWFIKIPEGGNWKSLNIDEQKEHLGKMFYSEGGKTGILKRLSFNEASPTLLTSPIQKQTQRCHPTENRPLNIREYARIQSFPDDWKFVGSIASQYKQIGNAVPVNLSYFVGKMIIEQIINIKKGL